METAGRHLSHFGDARKQRWLPLNRYMLNNIMNDEIDEKYIGIKDVLCVTGTHVRSRVGKELLSLPVYIYIHQYERAHTGVHNYT